jgi:copper transport protein
MRRSICPVRIALVALTVAGVVLAGAASPAFGHAAFLGSTPAPGQRMQQAPTQVVLRFTEALNQSLSDAALYDASTSRRIPTRVTLPAGAELALRPTGRLARGAYRVEWHSVSADDGHALEGSFSFGVRAAAVPGASSSEASPLGGGGWLRVVVRALLYPALFLFAGGLILDAMLSRGTSGGWIVPASGPGANERTELLRRYPSIVVDAGWLAAALAGSSALIDAAQAAGGIAAGAMADYLLGTPTGVARLAVPILIIVALPAAGRLRLGAAAAAAFALAALALSGHADSATPRAWALTSDWIHLLAGATWLGGIGLIALVWGGRLRRGDRELRVSVARSVLPRFGRVALPAFLVSAATGAVNAYLQLGRLSALWETSYGRTLTAKIIVVGLIAGLSYLHALWLRPRLLAANPHPSEQLERRHWRALRAEPLLGLGLAAVVALLVTFPLPRNVADAAPPSAASAPCDPCPQRLARANELSVAEAAGSNLVAAWIRRRPGRLEGQVRVLDAQGKPSSAPFEIQAAQAVTISCGPGCRRFAAAAGPSALRVEVHARGAVYTASLPTRWLANGTRRARRLLVEAQAAMRRVRSVRETEIVNSIPGLYAITDYALVAPDRMRYLNSTVSGSPPRRDAHGEAVVVGGVQWSHEPGIGWQRGEFGGGLPFKVRTWFAWTPYARSTRMLAVRDRGGRRVAEIALQDPGTPAWWRLWIDLRSHRVLRSRLITDGHFMTQRYFAFNRRLRITIPERP